MSEFTAHPFIETFTHTPIDLRDSHLKKTSLSPRLAPPNISLIRIFSEVAPGTPAEMLAKTPPPEDLFILCARGFMSAAEHLHPRLAGAVERTGHILHAQKSIKKTGGRSTTGYRAIQATIHPENAPHWDLLRPSEVVLQAAARMFGPPTRNRAKDADLCNPVNRRMQKTTGWLLPADVLPRERKVVGVRLTGRHNNESAVRRLMEEGNEIESTIYLPNANLWSGIMTLASEQALHDDARR